MATKRKDGRYQAVCIASPTSKSQRKYFYAETPEEAEALADKYYNLYVKGGYKEISFQEYREIYIDYRKKDLAVRTIDSYKSILRLHINPLLDKKNLGDINPRDIKNILKRIEIGGASGKTMSNVYQVMNTLFKQAVYDEFIPNNPVEKVQKPKHKRPDIKIIPLDHFTKIYKEADVEFKILLELVWSTGIRVGEVAGLKAIDIDDVQKGIHVRRAIARTSNGLIVKEPKTIYGKRFIPIPIGLIKILKKLSHKNGEFLFPDHNRNMQDPTEISKKFSKLCKQIDFDYHFHQIRHTHATMLADRGVQIKGIQERLGHHSAAFTIDTYTHKTAKAQEGIIDLDIYGIK